MKTKTTTTTFSVSTPTTKNLPERNAEKAESVLASGRPTRRKRLRKNREIVRKSFNKGIYTIIQVLQVASLVKYKTKNIWWK